MEGHELHEEDLRLMYTFDQVTGCSAQYEAHSDAQVLIEVIIFLSFGLFKSYPNEEMF